MMQKEICGAFCNLGPFAILQNIKTPVDLD